MSEKSALVLFAHGARDPRWAQPFLKMQAIASQRLPEVTVELAFLELMEPRLPVVVNRLVEQGCGRISVVPVFLGQGGHVLRDLPPMIEELRTSYPQLVLTVADAVGESPAVLQAIAGYCVDSLQ
jgi:sirohydrochlorin cobaltochelatase